MQTKPSKIVYKSNWTDVRDAAMTTIHKDGGKEPSPEWIRKILRAEHSPIRKYIVNWKWESIPYWVAMHLVRHHVGVTWFVGTQRDDRVGGDRHSKPQDALVPLEGEADAQALINISRKRLCRQASNETRMYWNGIRDEIAKNQPELADAMVPECVYRGFCPEFKSCGYVNTEEFKEKRNQYTLDSMAR